MELVHSNTLPPVIKYSVSLVLKVSLMLGEQLAHGYGSQTLLKGNHYLATVMPAKHRSHEMAERMIAKI